MIVNIVFLGRIWYLCLPAGLYFGYTAYSMQGGWKLRSLTILATLFLLVPVVYVAATNYQEYADQKEYMQEREAHAWVLEKTDTIAGLELPKKTKIYLKTTFNMNQKEDAKLIDVEQINLSEPTDLLGITFTDTVHRGRYELRGTLHGDQLIEGWPCRGEITLYEKRDYSGKDTETELQLQKCTLYQSHTVFDHTLPAGTEIELKSWDWTFNYPNRERIISIDPDSGDVTFDSNNLND